MLGHMTAGTSDLHWTSVPWYLHLSASSTCLHNNTIDRDNISREHRRFEQQLNRVGWPYQSMPSAYTAFLAWPGLLYFFPLRLSLSPPTRHSAAQDWQKSIHIWHVNSRHCSEVLGLCRWAQCDCGAAQPQWVLPPYLCGGPCHLQPVLVLVPSDLFPHPHLAANGPAGAECRAADAQATGSAT